MVLDLTPILKAKIILQFELSIEWQNLCILIILILIT
jgi:hypothetical protein